MNFLKKQSPVRIISLGFALVILIGSVLLSLPCSIRDGVTLRYIDALYMSTSAVCVTGLLTVDAGDTFTPLGQFFLGMLIQVGGLGVTAVGTGVILAMGKKINLKARNLIREAGNLDSGKGVIRFIRLVFLTTVTFELAGAALSFLVFRKNFPPLKAAGVSLFHSVASFNNSGFDILGGGQNLIPYQDDVLLNLVTCALVIFGGIGFLVIREVIANGSDGKSFPCTPGGAVYEPGADGSRHSAFKADRGYYLDGSFLYQCIRKNRRIFYISAGIFFRRRTSDGHCADGDRRFSGFYRRWYQDYDLLCAA